MSKEQYEQNLATAFAFWKEYGLHVNNETSFDDLLQYAWEHGVDLVLKVPKRVMNNLSVNKRPNLSLNIDSYCSGSDKKNYFFDIISPYTESNKINIFRLREVWDHGRPRLILFHSNEPRIIFERDEIASVELKK